MSKYRRWRNSQDAGIPVYATTTVLDHIHAFDTDDLKDLMTSILVSDCRLYGAALYGFVVMVNHVHVVVRPPAGKTQSWLLQRLKSNSAKLLLPALSSETCLKLASFQGLNDRMFWKDGFRGFALESEDTVRQKLSYTHQNPVRAGLVKEPTEYRWSSAQFMVKGWVDLEYGLDPQAVLDFYGLDPMRLRVSSQVAGRNHNLAPRGVAG